MKVVSGDGATYDPGPCDAILINAGVTHRATLWLERLEEGGRLVMPLTAKGTGVMLAISKAQRAAMRAPRQENEPAALGGADARGRPFCAGSLKAGAEFPARVDSFVSIYPFSTLRDPEIEPIFLSALGKREIFKLRRLRTDDHEKTSECLVHTAKLCLSS